MNLREETFKDGSRGCATVTTRRLLRNTRVVLQTKRDQL